MLDFNQTHKAIKIHKNIKIKSSCRQLGRWQSSVAKCSQQHWETLSGVSWSKDDKAGLWVLGVG